jgi:hypothetical protein
METKVILEAPELGSREFSIEHANRLLKLQGNDPNGWKLKEGQKFELNKDGTIVKKANNSAGSSKNTGPTQQGGASEGDKARGENSVS